MNQLLTSGIVLSRTDYGEADRIITLLTPDYGKLRLMAKGVRRVKSKLAGGIELFSVSDITFIRGRSEIGTLVSARLRQHFGQIVQNIERVQLGYESIKQLNKVTEDELEPEYFSLLQLVFEALNDRTIDETLIQTWYQAQLLKLAGHLPNLQTTAKGHKLSADDVYGFDFDTMALAPQPNGQLTANHIKLLRLLFSDNSPMVLTQVQGVRSLQPDLAPLVRTMFQTHLRV